MSVLLGTLGMGRAHALARMTETVRIGTLTTEDEPDRETLDPIVTFDWVYTGPARMKFITQTLSERDAAGQPIAIQSLELHVPSQTVGIVTDMYAVIDASTADTSLVGRVFRIKGLPQAGQTTAARFPVEETGETIPEES